MNRVDRLMGVIARIQSKKYQTAEQLAEHFGKSVRTVFRDLKAMQEIGVPFHFEPGLGYRYWCEEHEFPAPCFPTPQLIFTGKMMRNRL